MSKKRESYQPHIVKAITFHINQFLKQAENNVDSHIDFDSDKYKEALFLAQAPMCKDIARAIEEVGNNFKKAYKRELHYSKENPFPRTWMLKDKTISAMIETHKPFIQLANYLFERNRHFRGDKLQKMVDEADGRTKGKRYRNVHIFSTFTTNDAFFGEIAKKLNIPKNTVQAYLATFTKIGVIVLLVEGRKYGRLYADGYFKQSEDNKYRKWSFLKNDPNIITGLRRLPEFLNGYYKDL